MCSPLTVFGQHQRTNRKEELLEYFMRFSKLFPLPPRDGVKSKARANFSIESTDVEKCFSVNKQN